jgi:hypothetical protein
MAKKQQEIKGWIYDPSRPSDGVNSEEKEDIRISKRTILKNGLKGNYVCISDQMADNAVEGKDIYCRIEGCGRYKVISFSKSDKFIYFEKTTTTPSKNYIFYSFQSDNKDSTEFLQNLIEKIVGTINKDYKYLVNDKEIKLKRAHQPGDGTTNIAEGIKKQIQESMLFIADLTPLEISTTKDKNLNKKENGGNKKGKIEIRGLYNSNVCLELGYALLAKKPEQIVILCPLFKIPTDHRDYEQLKQAEMPFDIRSYHRIMEEDLNKFIQEATQNIVSQIIKMYHQNTEDHSNIINEIINICLDKIDEI